MAVLTAAEARKLKKSNLIHGTSEVGLYGFEEITSASSFTDNDMYFGLLYATETTVFTADNMLGGSAVSLTLEGGMFVEGLFKATAEGSVNPVAVTSGKLIGYIERVNEA